MNREHFQGVKVAAHSAHPAFESGRLMALNSMRQAFRPLLAALILGSAAADALAHCDQHAFSSTSVAQLKLIYLRCADVSSRIVLDEASMRRCSVAADQLRDRGFGGNFDQLIAWWQANRAPLERSAAIGHQTR